ncbi:MAG: helix-turn-helix transcriptional regulator [Chloroflexi bacterium]|nr:helix-turn-helix transcriptional regulator [Chloroflexota bacterium]OJV92828.1 MAG: helix-turn-helix transcriptional regulator [Chloroflexi bacterium 54-19]
MSIPILATKLYIPPQPIKAVSRPRLIERLNQGLQRNARLTLVSAQAGSGKTTLVTEWLAVCGRPSAWLSLDEGDSDPIRFLVYLVAALQRVAPKIGEGVMEVLQSSQPPPVETVLTGLLNEISGLPEKFFLVLDDYHVIEGSEVDKALTFLLDHLPPQMHLIITTREDPQLPLPRLRVRGQLVEVRAIDLRFSINEAAEFLNEVMGLDLSAENLATLEDRTEGWIAGLQLAALSMQGQQDVAGFIRAFAGDHRYIVDYLMEEVLQHLPPHVRIFLLQTSILTRLNGSLCEAVTGQAEGSARLEALERGNFFIVGLDDKRQWYRYHHLFAEVLYTHLRAEFPDQVAGLHRRASEWFEQNGFTAEAIRHALAASDYARVADLAERALVVMRSSRQATTMLGWLKALPDEVLRDRPVLKVGYAWALLSCGELDKVEAQLHEAEQLLSPAEEGPDTPAAEASLGQNRKIVVMDQAELLRVPGAIAIYRAAMSQARGEVAGTIKYARQALELSAEEDHLLQGAATGLLGLAYWTSGELEKAYRTYAEGMVRVQAAGNISDTISGAIARADIRIAQGRLHEAMQIYEQGLQLSREQGETILQGMADLYVGMSELKREYNELEAANQLLHQSKELNEPRGLPYNRSRWCVAMARIREAQGDLAGSLDLLTEAERLFTGDLFPNVRPVHSVIARLWIRQGKLGEAANWANAQELAVGNELSYLREFEYITLARLLLARYRSDTSEKQSLLEAVGLLGRLLKTAQAGDRTGSIIETLLLLALARQQQGDLKTALVDLEQALTLAEPEGYVRIFVDEGLPMMQLLQETAKSRPGPTATFARHLLSNMGSPEDTAPVKQDLIEPLSERELQVLRLLGSDLSGPEIARHLIVSLNTLNTHIKNIYTKLEVNNRRTAVHRARELHLL